MKTIKGPAIFLAQFMGDEPPFNSLDSICAYMASLGYKGVQIPTWENRLIDLEKAANSKAYCDELKGKVAEHGLAITELSTHLQGQLVAVHPVYDAMFDGFAPEEVRNNPKARTAWAVQQLKWAAQASRNMGIDASVSFSGALLWPFMYPWPQRPAGLTEMGFGELAKRWKPILDVYDEQGVDLCYELHPGEDIHDGDSFEAFLEALGGHSRCCINYDPSHFVLQCMDYVQFIDFYHERIKAFHVKDAEFNPTGKQGVYGGFQPWLKRAGRFRSLGDGDVDFRAIFSKLSEYDYDSWAVLEWECCIKSPEQGAAEGAPFIQGHIIEVTAKAFDDFAGGAADDAQNRQILGL
ncbi:sugar phosphate isomerase/epimerase family protein [Phaeodactylibacter luteus]|uniref:Sugar phosphate isomerase/epimerase n=1 Tax=Phaeodactylibacter luteus TaxID=1564516 RepID=A0A5C6RGF8_9BACT|nr:sugar phosphate isomerase/epimerase [Phaeodactylibacter luteus]TXB61387.1 sugar phosphate isomerase/epimerase [Phaeodactylibacter luteus]